MIAIESDLRKQLVTGDSSVFKEIYRLHFHMVKAFIEKNSGNADDAADIFQESIIVLYEKSRDGNLKLTASIKTYIYSIARNLWLKKLRDRKGKVSIHDFEEVIHIEEEEAREEVNLKEWLTEIGEACRKLLIMFYYKKYSMQEICDKLNYANADTVKNQKYKCLMRMKKLVNEKRI